MQLQTTSFVVLAFGLGIVSSAAPDLRGTEAPPEVSQSDRDGFIRREGRKFSYAWAVCIPVEFQSAPQNQPLNKNNSLGHVSNNRFQLADSVPFQKRFEAVNGDGLSVRFEVSRQY